MTTTISALQHLSAAAQAPAKLGDSYPAGTAHVDRSGTKTAFRAIGGVGALSGSLLIGAALFSRGQAAESITRLRLGPLAAATGALLIGAGLVGSSFMLPPKSVTATHVGIPTRDLAQRIANESSNQHVIEDVNGTFAVVYEAPHYSGGGYSGGGSRSHNNNNDYDPGPVRHNPSYPSGGTSSGDGPSHSSGGSSSSHSSGNSSGYGNPSPPSSGGSHSSGGGNSSSNGNPGFE